MPPPKSNAPDNILNHHTVAELLEALEKKKTLKLPVECRGCGQEFIRNRSWQDFCSTPCKTAWHQRQRDSLVAALLARVKELEEELVRFRKP